MFKNGNCLESCSISLLVLLMSLRAFRKRGISTVRREHGVSLALAHTPYGTMCRCLSIAGAAALWLYAPILNKLILTQWARVIKSFLKKPSKDNTVSCKCEQTARKEQAHCLL